MLKNGILCAAAAAAYLFFAVYLYFPHFESSSFLSFSRLFLLNSAAGGAGCFILSRRWTSSFWASFFAGALYAFGAFTLNLSQFHPLVGLLVASLPFSFLPSAYGFDGKLKWLRIFLAAIPFILIVVFFQLANMFKFFPIPIQYSFQPSDLGSLISPLATAKAGRPICFGFYHVALVPLIIGFAMLFAARRINVMTVLIISILLSCMKPFAAVSPVIWLTITYLICCVLAGVGIQGLVSAGDKDGKIILYAAIAMLVFCIINLLLSVKYQSFFTIPQNYSFSLPPHAGLFLSL
jgi:hypothetical protein